MCSSDGITWHCMFDLEVENCVTMTIVYTLLEHFKLSLVHFNPVACFFVGQRFGLFNCDWIGPLDDFHPTLAGFDDRGGRTFWCWSRRFKLCRICEN